HFHAQRHPHAMHLPSFPTRRSSDLDALNARHAGDQDLFFLLHRPRTWNPRERRWMGHERKRGKLVALNDFLHERDGRAFSAIVGDRKSTRLNSSHVKISYAVLCLKK